MINGIGLTGVGEREGNINDRESVRRQGLELIFRVLLYIGPGYTCSESDDIIQSTYEQKATLRFQ